MAWLRDCSRRHHGRQVSSIAARTTAVRATIRTVDALPSHVEPGQDGEDGVLRDLPVAAREVRQSAQRFHLRGDELPELGLFVAHDG